MTVRLKSAEKEGRQILGVISKADADELLTMMANLSHSTLTAGSVRLLFGGDDWKKYAAVFDFVPEDRDLNEVLGRFQYYLRQAWTANKRARDWYLLRARETEARYRAAFSIGDEQDTAKRNIAIEKMLDEVPAATPLEAALFHLQEIPQNSRRCKNSECERYFISYDKGQRYCSSECSNESRKKFKRQWWRDNRARGEHHAKRSHRQD